MATSLFALLDDIATVLDDVAVLSKAAAKKTSGVLGDDLALNANQVAGVRAERELPVVWAVAKGSLKNKAILVPSALLLSAAAPWAVTPLLMLGGLYLCYEGFEKVAHRFLHGKEDEAEHAALIAAVADSEAALVAHEKGKIAGAIRTDFSLSAEIIIDALGAAEAAPFPVRAAVVAAIALAMTVFVYGFVAAIVKLDDLGQTLSGSPASAPLGRALLRAAPLLMKALSVLGTAAMFLVGGSILGHGLHAPPGMLIDGAIGLSAGALALGAVSALRRVALR